MNVRAKFRSDGAKSFEEVPGGLNRMSIRRFEKLVAQSGFEMTHCRYQCIRGMDLLGRLPFVRELFINHVVCELKC